MKQKANRITFLASDYYHKIHLIEWKLKLKWNLGETTESATGDIELEWERMLTYYQEKGRNYSNLYMTGALVASDIAISKGRILWITQEENITDRDKEIQELQNKRILPGVINETTDKKEMA